MSLRRVGLGRKSFNAYRQLIAPALFSEVKSLAKPLRSARVLHINSTARGGGVAQLLNSLIPLYNDLGIQTDWFTTEAVPSFYQITKKLHNSLQGAKVEISPAEWRTYEAQNQKFTSSLKSHKWDFIFIHDPQPAAIIKYAELEMASWIWRCHLDLSRPHAPTLQQFQSYLSDYDAAIYTLKQYIPKALKLKRQLAIAPAIDPLSDTNRRLNLAECTAIVAGYGVDLKRPYIVQVSRFDVWKDPLGVITAWERARRKIPGLQLVLVGDSALDDPEGQSVLKAVMAKAARAADIFIVTDSSSLAVNAFQTLATVVLQKSIREGFALTVSEALWKGIPVIGGKVGGIPLQISDGQSGYLVATISEAAERIAWLVGHPQPARKMGKAGREQVAKHFLLPRLMRDELRLLSKI